VEQERTTEVIHHHFQVKGESIMKCYVCAKQGKDSDAIATCITCGMSLCMDHAIYKEYDVFIEDYRAILAGYKKLPQKLPKFRCSMCDEVFSSGEPYIRLISK
jgi:hypothetical protein